MAALVELIKVHRVNRTINGNKTRKGEIDHKAAIGMVIVTPVGTTKMVEIGATETLSKADKEVAVKVP